MALTWMDERGRSGGALKRVVAGAASGALGHVINLAGQVGTVPLFLWAWGAQRYGEWLTLSAAAAYLALLDFGMGLYVVNRLTAHHAEGDVGEYQRVLGTSFALYLSIAGAVIVLGGLVLALFSPSGLLDLAVTDDWTARIVGFLLVVQMAGTIPYGLLLGLYRTFGEFHVGAMIRNAQQILALVGTTAGLALGGSLVEVAAIPLVASAVCAGFVLYDLKRRHSSLPVVVGPFDCRLAAHLLGPSLVFLAIQLSLALTIQGSVLLVNALYGAAAVTLFVTVRTLVNTLRQLVGLVNHPTWPELIRLKARNEYATLRATHRLLAKGCLALTSSFAIFLHFTGVGIISMWTAGRMQPDQRLLDAFLILAVAQTIWFTSSSFPMAFNRHYKVAACYALSGMFGLAAAWGLGRKLGLVGVVAGLLVADVLFCGVTIPSGVCRLLGDRPLAFWRDIALGGVPVIAAQWAVASGVDALVPPGWLRLALLGLCLSSMTVGLGFRFWLSGQERALVRGLFEGRMLASVRA